MSPPPHIALGYDDAPGNGLALPLLDSRKARPKRCLATNDDKPMSAEWECRATRGEHSVTVLTALRAFGITSVAVRGTPCKFLVRILADGDTEHFEVLCPDEKSVRTWLEDMSPHTLEILVSPKRGRRVGNAGDTSTHPLKDGGRRNSPAARTVCCAM